jgi:hypothetical protein
VTPRWKLLVDAGVPDGPVRPAPAGLDRPRLAAAVRDLARRPDAVHARQVEPLLAWLRGWRHHWPSSFAATLGAAGDALIARLEARGVDRNRYLKLRRIAVANLAAVL